MERTNIVGIDPQLWLAFQDEYYKCIEGQWDFLNEYGMQTPELSRYYTILNQIKEIFTPYVDPYRIDEDLSHLKAHAIHLATDALLRENESLSWDEWIFEFEE